MTRNDPIPAGLMVLFADGPGSASADALLKTGATDNDLERWIRTGQLRRISRGRYVLSRPTSDADAWVSQSHEHLTRLAGIQAVAADAVGASRTAALVHGLTVYRIPPEPEVIRHPARPKLLGARVIRTAVAELHRMSFRGFEITSPARTAVDVALDEPVPTALVTVDSALAQGTSREAMVEILRDRGSVRGCRRARRSIAWADGHSESALESFSRGQLLGLGVPQPLCNVSLSFAGRTYRVDTLWDDLGIVGEADGRIKYEGELAIGDSLWREKLRQEWLESELGLIVVRWTSDEIRNDAAGVVSRWQRAKARRDREPWVQPEDLMMSQRSLLDPRVVLNRQNLG